jgi:uncharacterized Zn-finger protein
MTGSQAASRSEAPTEAMTEAKVAAMMCRRNRREIVTEPFETITVDTDRVACDGGGGPLGHPKVYLNLGAENRVECPYCSRLYVLREGAARHEHAH